MKKLISLVLALIFVFSMATVAFAAENDTTIDKTYTLTGDAATAFSPEETFGFSVEFVSATDTGVGYTEEWAKANLPTISSVSYTKGEASSSGATKQASITLPTYPAIGIYTYNVTENVGTTAGVTYRNSPIRLVVTVAYNGSDEKYEVIAIHTEDDTDGTTEKSNGIENNYAAGKLAVSKTVTGTMGDRNQYFPVTVTFKAPTGKTVKETINYTVGTENRTIATTAWTNGVATANISLKHEDTITFTNIPYDVTYTVEEQTPSGYEATYNYDADGDSNTEYDKEQGLVTLTIDDAEDKVTITNNKGGDPDTGITLDSLPFVLILAVCAGAVVLFVIKRRNSVEF